jgi:heat shock protein HslJ
MMACEEPVMNQEQAYFKALTDSKSFTATAETLTLLDSGGKVLAEYKAVSQDLAGTSWMVNSYNNGNQAVVSVLEGSELTAEFASDGTLSGSSGCNTFTGGYTVDGEKITIGPLATTMMACEEDLMNQEAQYLAALQSAAVYSIDGNTLQLRTADDALAALFDRK